jgi:hypothetical protein
MPMLPAMAVTVIVIVVMNAGPRPGWPVSHEPSMPA